MIDIMTQGACAPHRQKGFLLIAAVILIAVLAAFFTVSFTFFFVSNTGSGLNHMQSAQALYVAESGLERAVSDFRASGTSCAALSYTNVSFPPGSFTAAGTIFNP